MKIVPYALLIILFASTMLYIFWEQTPTKLSHNLLDIQSTSLPVKPEVAAQKHKTENSQNALPIENEHPSDDAIFKVQFSQVADSYLQTAQFPVNSQPISHPDEVYEPAPFEEAQFTIPFPMQGGGTLQVNAALNKFTYFAGEKIEVQVTVKGAPQGAYVQAQGSFANAERDLPNELLLNTNNDSFFSGQVDTSTMLGSDFTPEMLLKVLVKVDGEEFFITQGFRYFKASANVVGIGRVEVNSANLDIPVKLNVDESGYYFMRAVLVDEESSKPLVALQAEGRFAKGSRELLLQAHIQALKVGGSEGPYILKNINLYRGANENEEFDVPGKSDKKRYAVSGFSFSQYDDVVHVDKLAHERAAFLRSLGK